jgi:hypothetical protein
MVTLLAPRVQGLLWQRPEATGIPRLLASTVTATDGEFLESPAWATRPKLTTRQNTPNVISFFMCSPLLLEGQGPVGLNANAAQDLLNFRKLPGALIQFQTAVNAFYLGGNSFRKIFLFPVRH